MSERDVMQAVQYLTGLQPCVVSLTPYQLSDVWEVCTACGQSTELSSKQAQELIRSYKRRLEHLQDITINLSKGRPEPRIALLEWLDPLMATGNWTPELIRYAGGENIFGEIGQHAPWITWKSYRLPIPIS